MANCMIPYCVVSLSFLLLLAATPSLSTFTATTPFSSPNQNDQSTDIRPQINFHFAVGGDINPVMMMCSAGQHILLEGSFNDGDHKTIKATHSGGAYSCDAMYGGYYANFQPFNASRDEFRHEIGWKIDVSGIFMEWNYSEEYVMETGWIWDDEYEKRD